MTSGGRVAMESKVDKPRNQHTLIWASLTSNGYEYYQRGFSPNMEVELTRPLTTILLDRD
jgi:hypothetical protein